VHLACANPFAVATRNELRGDHPLFRLIWPHIDGTQDSNEVTTYIQLAPDGDFVNMYSFTLAGLCAYLDDVHDAFDMALVDPELDWRSRRLDGLALDAPVQENMRELHAVALRHAGRYVDHYYRDDAALAADPAVQRWHAALEAGIPGGVAAFLPQGLTRAGVARLIGGFIHLGAGIHGLLGNAMWNYQPFADKLPLRVYQDGRRLPHDVYQRMINQNFVLNVRRALLLSDYSVAALDDDGVRLFRQFRDEYQGLQNRYATTLPPEAWRMMPEDLEISMSGFG
jgi:arachidonate 15-lipoxygenase